MWMLYIDREEASRRPEGDFKDVIVIPRVGCSSTVRMPQGDTVEHIYDACPKYSELGRDRCTLHMY